nr:MAG TPA: DcaP membrane protein, Acinetobacter baumannii [Caudoviricetes sp.]
MRGSRQVAQHHHEQQHVGPAHAEVEARAASVTSSSSCQPRACGGRGLLDTTWLVLMASAPRTWG